MFPNRVPMGSDAPSPVPLVYFSFMSVCRSLQKGALLQNGQKHKVTVHGAPRREKAYIEWGAAWFPKGIVNDIAISVLVPCSLRQDTFHLGLGRPEPRQPVCVIATPITVYPPQLLPPPTWPRVEHESTILRGTDEGLDSWEACRVSFPK